MYIIHHHVLLRWIEFSGNYTQLDFCQIHHPGKRRTVAVDDKLDRNFRRALTSTRCSRPLKVNLMLSRILLIGTMSGNIMNGCPVDFYYLDIIKLNIAHFKKVFSQLER